MHVAAAATRPATRRRAAAAVVAAAVVLAARRAEERREEHGRRGRQDNRDTMEPAACDIVGPHDDHDDIAHTGDVFESDLTSDVNRDV